MFDGNSSNCIIPHLPAVRILVVVNSQLTKKMKMKKLGMSCIQEFLKVSTVPENPEGHTHIHRFSMPRRDLMRFNLLPQVDNEQEVKAMAQLLFAEALKLCFNRHTECLGKFSKKFWFNAFKKNLCPIINRSLG